MGVEEAINPYFGQRSAQFRLPTSLVTPYDTGFPTVTQPLAGLLP